MKHNVISIPQVIESRRYRQRLLSLRAGGQASACAALSWPQDNMPASVSQDLSRFGIFNAYPDQADFASKTQTANDNKA